MKRAEFDLVIQLGEDSFISKMATITLVEGVEDTTRVVTWVNKEQLKEYFKSMIEYVSHIDDLITILELKESKVTLRELVATGILGLHCTQNNVFAFENEQLTSYINTQISVFLAMKEGGRLTDALITRLVRTLVCMVYNAYSSKFIFNEVNANSTFTVSSLIAINDILETKY